MQLYREQIVLTSNEARIVVLLAEGMQSKEIAVALGKSKATVEGYVRLLFAKLCVRSRAQLVARVYSLGLVEDLNAAVKGGLSKHMRGETDLS